MASALNVLTAFVGFKPERRVALSPKRVDCDEEMDESPTSSEDEESYEDLTLEALENLSLKLKLWLRRIHLTEQERPMNRQDLEHEIYLTQEKVINPYKAFLISNKSNDPKDLPMLGYYDQRLEEACEKLLIEKNKVNFEMPEEDHRRFDKYEVFVCSLLGLNLDFLDCLEEMSSIQRHHRTLDEWIEIVLQNNSESVSSASKNTLTKELLVSIGFDPLSTQSTATETIMARSLELSTHHHIEACEWAEIFIADEFKYNPLLSSLAARFPFEGHLTNTWFQRQSRNVNIRNVVIKESLNSAIIQSILSDKVSHDEQNIVLYHGTDHHSAEDILVRGIDLCCGRQKRDFSCGSGFYLTKSLDVALNWAKSTTTKPAILVFQVDRECLSNAKKLDLSPANQIERWRKIVSSFRSGKRTARTRKSLRLYDLIEGPTATLMISETSGELMLEPKASSHQICLISEDFAEEFQQTLHSVLFFEIS